MGVVDETGGEDLTSSLQVRGQLKSTLTFGALPLDATTDFRPGAAGEAAAQAEGHGNRGESRCRACRRRRDLRAERRAMRW